MLSNDKKRELLSYRDKLLEEIKYYENRVEEEQNSNVDLLYDDDSSDDEDVVPHVATNASISHLKQQRALLNTCLQATQELTELVILQKEITPLSEAPEFHGEKPVNEDGLWYEITAECRIDLVLFTIMFHVHKPKHQFAPLSYRNLKVNIVKEMMALELSESVLAKLTKPSDAVEVIKGYAIAHRSRRTTFRRLNEKFGEALFMNPTDNGGYTLTCADLLTLTWKLENIWSPISPFLHQKRFRFEYMDESYLKTIKDAHHRLLDQSIDTDERTHYLSTIISTCIQINQSHSELNDNQDSDTAYCEKLVDKSTNKRKNVDNEIMAPPKAIPKKAKVKGKENHPNSKANKRPNSDHLVSDPKKVKLNNVQSNKDSNKVSKDRDSNRNNVDNDPKTSSKVFEITELVKQRDNQDSASNAAATKQNVDRNCVVKSLNIGSDGMIVKKSKNGNDDVTNAKNNVKSTSSRNSVKTKNGVIPSNTGDKNNSAKNAKNKNSKNATSAKSNADKTAEVNKNDVVAVSVAKDRSSAPNMKTKEISNTAIANVCNKTSGSAARTNNNKNGATIISSKDGKTTKTKAKNGDSAITTNVVPNSVATAKSNSIKDSTRTLKNNVPNSHIPAKVDKNTGQIEGQNNTDKAKEHKAKQKDSNTITKVSSLNKKDTESKDKNQNNVEKKLKSNSQCVNVNNNEKSSKGANVNKGKEIKNTENASNRPEKVSNKINTLKKIIPKNVDKGRPISTAQENKPAYRANKKNSNNGISDTNINKNTKTNEKIMIKSTGQSKANEQTNNLNEDATKELEKVVIRKKSVTKNKDKISDISKDKQVVKNAQNTQNKVKAKDFFGNLNRNKITGNLAQIFKTGNTKQNGGLRNSKIPQKKLGGVVKHTPLRMSPRKSCGIYKTSQASSIMKATNIPRLMKKT